MRTNRIGWWSYRIVKTWKWTKKLFFHLTDMAILSAFLLHKTCGKMTQIFREVLVRNLITESREQNVTASGVSRGRPSPSVSQISRLEVKHSQHWPSKGKRRSCVRTLKNKWGSTMYVCASLMFVCASWTVLKDGIREWMCESNVSYQGKLKDNTKMYSLPKKQFLHSLFCK
jgi:hypothetical protein